MFWDVVLLLVGFVLLVKGADFFVDGSSSIAKLLGVPGFVIGLTIVAMGTSAPEAAVSITASATGANEIAISNIVGSNIFNLLMVAGVCAVIKPYKIEKVMINRDFTVNVVISVLLVGLMILGRSLGVVDGVVLLLGIVAYVGFVLLSAFRNRDTYTEDLNTKRMSPVVSVLCIVGGLAAIIGGGQLVVENAKSIAYALGWSETFVGLTIVAIGTSLPELVTSVVAARKGESGMALGNVIGSNIFNILFILGISSVISPISADGAAIANALILLGITAAVYAACFIRKGMGRVVGGVCVAGYVGYTAYLLMTTI